MGGVGREFFLLWVVGDGITYDGMYVMRHRDVSELEAPDKHAPFMEKALAVKHLMPRTPRGFPLDNIREVIQAAAVQAPVIGVHVDSEDESEVCYIGRLVSVEEDGFNMQEITPDAEWLREASFFSLGRGLHGQHRGWLCHVLAGRRRRTAAVGAGRFGCGSRQLTATPIRRA